MSSSAVAFPIEPKRPGWFVVGKTFLHPALDYLLVGGALSLAIGAATRVGGVRIGADTQWWLVLVFNMAHFASSSVRLYAKPGAVRSAPMLTVALPIVTVLLLLAAIRNGRGDPPWLMALYLGWSAYHYAAQAYGVSVLYAYRSGVELSLGDKRLLKSSSLAPAVFGWFGPAGALAQLVHGEVLDAHPRIAAVGRALLALLWAASFAAPIAVFVGLRRARGRALPAISLLVLLVNATWWTFFRGEAFFWSALFHAVQYLALAMIFHAKDRARAPGERHGGAYHAITFYAASLALGYALFHLSPKLLGFAGFNAPATAALVSIFINLHHFFVDGFIWKLRKDPNARATRAVA